MHGRTATRLWLRGARLRERFSVVSRERTRTFRMFGALLFPVGLVMIVISGADLFTTNIMVRSL
jgi:formate/nitrite transporter FocA (FNT family)